LIAREILSANCLWMSVVMLKASAVCGFRREQKEEVRKVCKNDIKIIGILNRTGSSCLDSESEEDSDTDLGSQATGGSASALDGDNDDDLLSSSICHY
jgi:hypothetical protein